MMNTVCLSNIDKVELTRAKLCQNGAPHFTQLPIFTRNIRDPTVFQTKWYILIKMIRAAAIRWMLTGFIAERPSTHVNLSISLASFH